MIVTPRSADASWARAAADSGFSPKPPRGLSAFRSRILVPSPERGASASARRARPPAVCPRAQVHTQPRGLAAPATRRPARNVRSVPRAPPVASGAWEMLAGAPRPRPDARGAPRGGEARGASVRSRVPPGAPAPAVGAALLLVPAGVCRGRHGSGRTRKPVTPVPTGPSFPGALAPFRTLLPCEPRRLVYGAGGARDGAPGPAGAGAGASGGCGGPWEPSALPSATAQRAGLPTPLLLAPPRPVPVTPAPEPPLRLPGCHFQRAPCLCVHGGDPASGSLSCRTADLGRRAGRPCLGDQGLGRGHAGCGHWAAPGVGVHGTEVRSLCPEAAQRAGSDGG